MISASLTFPVVSYPWCLPASQSDTAHWPAASSRLRPRNDSFRRLAPAAGAATARTPSGFAWVFWRTGREAACSLDCSPHLDNHRQPIRTKINEHVDTCFTNQLKLSRVHSSSDMLKEDRTTAFRSFIRLVCPKWLTVIHTLMAAMQRQQVSTMTSPNISPESDCTFKLFRDQLVVFFIKSEARRCDDVTALCRIWFAVWKSCECCKTEEERITHLFHGCSYFYILERQTDFYSKSLKLVTLKSVTLLKKSIFFFCHFLLLLFCSVCVYWAGLTDCLYIYILTAAF